MANLKAVIDVEGSDAVSSVLLRLLNSFPGLSGDVVAFSDLGEREGLAVFSSGGAMYQQNREDVTGHVYQRCLYPFVLIYRAAPRSEIQKLRIKEYLDLFGRWLEMQPVTIGGVDYKLEEYPELESGNRRILNIERSTPSYLEGVYQDGVEDWRLTMSLVYENEFDK